MTDTKEITLKGRTINVEYLKRSIESLRRSLDYLVRSVPDSVEYDIYRNAVVKGYELTLELAGGVLKKALKPYFASPTMVDRLVFKDIFRNAGKHGLLTQEEVERWLNYRDNRNLTAHDYGLELAEEKIEMLPAFIKDAQTLLDRLGHDVP